MIDAERMLGSLVRNAMSGGRRRGGRGRRRGLSLLGGVGKGSLALGALGVAIGAFEHFTQKQGGVGSEGSTAGPAPASPELTLPPLPPLPGTASATPVPPPPSSAQPEPVADEALLLVRAMIAAANADHEVDDGERARILEALNEADAGEEEKNFLRREFDTPIDMATLAAEATTPELVNQVYLASLMVIEVDTRAERNYLDRLAQRLGLERERALELEETLDRG